MSDRIAKALERARTNEQVLLPNKRLLLALAVIERAADYVGYAHLPCEPEIADSCRRLYDALSAWANSVLGDEEKP